MKEKEMLMEQPLSLIKPSKEKIIRTIRGKVSNINKVHEGTLEVLVSRQKKDKSYGKEYSRTKKYMVQCSKTGVYSLNREVIIVKSRPHSKTKHWEVYSPGEKI